MPAPYTDLQNLNQTSGFLELYSLDTTALGGTVYNFTNNVSPAGGSIVFGTTTYTALPIMTEGWDFTAAGQTPKPTLTVSNVQKTLLAAVVSLGDIVGAKLTRIRTYEKYLDAASFAQRNLLNYSQSPVQATWTKGSVTASDNVVTAPDGTLTGGRIVETAVTPSSPFFFIAQTKAAGGTTLTASVFVKAAERTFANIRIDDTGSTNTAQLAIDLATGTLGAIGLGGNASNGIASVVDAGNGWWRLILTVTFAAITNFNFKVRPAIGLQHNAAHLGYAGDPTKGISVWGMQVEVGSVATEYQLKTTTHQPFADPTKYLGPDVYVVEQKTAHNKNIIQWQMTSIIDRLGMKIPRRQVLKDKGFPGVARTRLR